MSSHATYGPGSPDWLERYDVEALVERLRERARANAAPVDEPAEPEAEAPQATPEGHDPDGRRITQAVAARDFILAPTSNGSAIFTVVSARSGARYTYKVTRADDADLMFVGALTGPDNDADYTYLGIIPLDDEAFRTTRGTKVASNAPSLVAFEWMWERLGLAKVGDLTEDAGFEFWHEGRCGRCGRRLSVPSSIAAGYGPTCQEFI